MSTTLERVQLSHCSLGRLRPAMKAFIIFRVEWGIVYTGSDSAARTNLMFVDADGSAMKTVIPNGVLRWFSGKIVEGGVYKILRFEIVERKLSFEGYFLRLIKDQISCLLNVTSRALLPA
ncbi:hypothetical protein COLO4_20691 [Corchorus olitorius]|uniref:Nucleic acid-binding protein n=1 Tax=Corchorus olitorius TaxID=93759 RepID=A0A1R3IXJ5_9ROSI|nr:hypothetical protein COLO4_20691 [Corchorus olitorius]